MNLCRPSTKHHLSLYAFNRKPDNRGYASYNEADEAWAFFRRTGIVPLAPNDGGVAASILMGGAASAPVQSVSPAMARNHMGGAALAPVQSVSPAMAHNRMGGAASAPVQSVPPAMARNRGLPSPSQQAPASPSHTTPTHRTPSSPAHRAPASPAYHTPRVQSMQPAVQAVIPLSRFYIVLEGYSPGVYTTL